MSRRLLLAMSVAAGVTYLAGWPGGAASVVVKAAAVSALAIAAWAQSRSLAAGLAFSSLGDVLLELGSGLFVWGLAAFLATHLIYLLLFRRYGPVPLRVGAARAVGLVLLAGFAVMFALRLSPHLGTLGVPVFLYIAAITGMVAAALLAEWCSVWVIAGAILFLISDSLLGWNRFVGPVPGRGWLVWTTYYGGQLAITAGVLRQVRPGAGGEKQRGSPLPSREPHRSEH